MHEAMPERAVFTRPDSDESVGGALRRYGPGVVLRVLRRMSFVKSLYCSARFRALVVIGRRTTLSLPRGARIEVKRGGALIIGIDQRLVRHSLLEIHRGGLLTCEGMVSMCRGTKLVIGGHGSLSLGGGTYFNDECYMTFFDHSRIGASSAISWRVTITDTDMHEIVRGDRTSAVSAPVRIGDNVWIGAGAIVLKGVTIGDGAIISAGAVVHGDVLERCLVAGNPAVVVDRDVSWRH